MITIYFDNDGLPRIGRLRDELSVHDAIQIAMLIVYAASKHDMRQVRSKFGSGALWGAEKLLILRELRRAPGEWIQSGLLARWCTNETYFTKRIKQLRDEDGHNIECKRKWLYGGPQSLRESDRALDTFYRLVLPRRDPYHKETTE